MQNGTRHSSCSANVDLTTCRTTRFMPKSRGRRLDCIFSFPAIVQDSTLPGLPKQRTFIAANLKEVEDLMPHYVLQLLIAVSLLPKGQAYVSIYESGSHDSTGLGIS